MLYIVGSDLERKLLIHTRMLLGLMEGIYEYKRMTADNEKTDDYAILAETGGVCLDPDNTVTCSIGDDAKQEYGRLREKLSERLRLRKKNGSGQDRYYDMFRGRAMFPIIDAHGNVLAFGGRTAACKAQDRRADQHGG